MSRPVSSALKTASKPALKNPLRASTMPLLAPPTVSEEPESAGHDAAAPAPEVTAQQLRRMQISEFSAWLRTQANRDKRPFQEETIRGYAETARARPVDGRGGHRRRLHRVFRGRAEQVLRGLPERA
jgi:hypothetical protein